MQRVTREIILSPEFFTGKLYWLSRMLFDITILLITGPSWRSLLLARLILKVTPKYTMLSTFRLKKLFDLVFRISALNIEGDIVECGTWNGGSAAVMAFANNMMKSARQIKRDVWLFDSFKGLPKSTGQDGLIGGDKLQGLFKGSAENVKEIFRTLNIPLSNIHIVEGWFEDTLGIVSIQKIALLHIDTDIYDSVKICLNRLYDRVVEGGFVVCDDYSWKGCRQAVNEFMKEHNLENEHLTKVEGAVCFQRPVSIIE